MKLVAWKYLSAMNGASIMKKNRLTSILLSVILCVIILAATAGNVYAWPLQAAVTYSVGRQPFSIAVGDFNLDGKPDLAVANQLDGNVSILLGNGVGGFVGAVGSPVGVGRAPVSIVVGDFNLDSKPDLAVVNNSDKTISILLGNGAGGFAGAAGSPIGVGNNPYSVAVGDFNKDGKPDLAVTNASDDTVTILLGNGAGGFAEAAGSPIGVGRMPTYIAVGDFNRDGKPDLVTANAGDGSVAILIGNGSGGFATAVPYSAGTGSSPFGLAVGDFNLDGKLDLAVPDNGSNTVSILLGNGDGTFAGPVPYTVAIISEPWGIAVGDFNLDGKPDLATANFGSTTTSILLGNGNGTFPASIDYAAGTNPISVAVGDFNQDGFPDLAMANYGSLNISIFLNTPEPPTITTVNPASGLQGQSLSVIITGTKFAGSTIASFGTGIAVNSITVNSLTQITANITIAGDATAGVRNVSVTTPGGTSTKTGGFTVIEVPQNTMIGAGAPTSHGSSVSAPTSPAPPVSLPNIQIQSASLSAKSVTPGTPIKVTADIANKSAVNGNKKITLYVNGQVETTQGITVNSGNSTRLTFNVSRSEPGDYIVYVDGVPAGSFKVEMVTEPDSILIFSAILVALAFMVGMFMLWRRQKRTV